jgi:hypothetical protein
MPVIVDLSIEFRKAPPINSTGRLVPGDCWIGWDFVIRTYVFSYHLVLEGVLRIYVVCCHHRTRLLCSMVKSEAENVMKA